MIAGEFARYEVKYLSAFVDKLKVQPLAADPAISVFKLVEELCKSALIPNAFRLCPEMTRATALRGEAYDLKHHELFAGTGVRHQPTVLPPFSLS